MPDTVRLPAEPEPAHTPTQPVAHVPEGLLTPEEQNRGMFWLITGNGLSTILVDTNFYGNFFMLFLAELKLDTGKIGSD